jgi:hypothetical protein
VETRSGLPKGWEQLFLAGDGKNQELLLTDRRILLTSFAGKCDTQVRRVAVKGYSVVLCQCPLKAIYSGLDCLIILS